MQFMVHTGKGLGWGWAMSPQNLYSNKVSIDPEKNSSRPHCLKVFHVARAGEGGYSPTMKKDLQTPTDGWGQGSRFLLEPTGFMKLMVLF